LKASFPFDVPNCFFNFKFLTTICFQDQNGAILLSETCQGIPAFVFSQFFNQFLSSFLSLCLFAQFSQEYCLADLSRYREGGIGLRWRTESEVKSGKGFVLFLQNGVNYL
jgi:hypothetical protein